MAKRNTTTNTHTPDSIRVLLETNDRAVERAIIALYQYQTEDEQQNKTTRHKNGVGFSGADVGILSQLARQLLTGTYEFPDGRTVTSPKAKHLTPAQVGMCRKRVMKYTRQLAEIANNRPVVEPTPTPVPPTPTIDVDTLMNDVTRTWVQAWEASQRYNKTGDAGDHTTMVNLYTVFGGGLSQVKDALNNTTRYQDWCRYLVNLVGIGDKANPLHISHQVVEDAYPVDTTPEPVDTTPHPADGADTDWYEAFGPDHGTTITHRGARTALETWMTPQATVDPVNRFGGRVVRPVMAH